MFKNRNFLVKIRFVKILSILLISTLLLLLIIFPVSAIVPPENKAKSAVLIEADTGKVLYEKNGNEKLPIASVTKIMTMNLVMEEIDSGRLNFDSKITVSQTACSMGGSQVYLKEGEEFTVLELLKAVAIHSANDASVALAEKIAGSEAGFVAEMNRKAEKLGMKNTNFLDCTGLTDVGHFSSAFDVALMSKDLLTKHPSITQFTSSWHDTFRNGSFSLDNTNKLIRFYNGAIGLKTGFTSIAGFNLAAAAKRNNLLLISVVLGEADSNTRFGDSKKLLDYGFINFERKLMAKKDEIINQITVKKGLNNQINAIIENDVSFLTDKGSKAEVSRKLILPESISAPIKKGDKLGEVIFQANGKELGRASVISDRDVMKATFSDIFSNVLKKWIYLNDF
jgi:D-alanyl-D-alanine carboxypeptidase (penicillin-binding protein 5/6)